MMSDQQKFNYSRIAAFIDYLKANSKVRPGLDLVASNLGLDISRLQLFFIEWAGTTAENFLYYISPEHVKHLLEERHTALFSKSLKADAPGSGLSHDHFIRIEAMIPEEYGNNGKKLSINYSFSDSPFGNLIIASTPKGICYLSFSDDENKALNGLKRKFSLATFQKLSDINQQNALMIFRKTPDTLPPVKVHVKGTAFQLKVWNALLKVPMGKLTTYGNIAVQLGNPKASRAVGTAIGSNPIAFLIPCHRVIQSTGSIGGYMWGNTRKTAIIGWESARAVTAQQ